MQLRNLFVTIITACLVMTIIGCEKTARVDESNEAQPQQRIGVYDSRCVAVAFAGNPEHEARTAQEMAALEAAKQQGDPDSIAAADKIVWDSRKRLHHQGFGTAPVDDIFAFYPEQLEAIKQKHNLVTLVSQWDKQTLKTYRNTEQIDITVDLIDMLNPNARQRRSALSIRDHKPLTDKQVEKVIEQEMKEH